MSCLTIFNNIKSLLLIRIIILLRLRIIFKYIPSTVVTLRQILVFNMTVLGLVLSGYTAVQYSDKKAPQNYAEFRYSQQSFSSTDGEIKYIDKG